MSNYTPADGDAGYYLRAMVTYKDRESVRDTKTAVGVSANAVKAARSDNDAPEFIDEDDEARRGSQATREVAENTAAGEAIGDPIVAEDEQRRRVDLHAVRCRLYGWRLWLCSPLTGPRAS